MAITRECDTTPTMSVAEYCDYVLSNVDTSDRESVVDSAPMLQRVANNKQLLVEFVNRKLLDYSDRSMSPYAQSSFILADHHEKGFFVRGNIWALSDPATAKLTDRLFSYDYPHDHNFDFMTANWFGPGYTTEIWEYDYAKVQGYVGERVEMEFLERVDFRPGLVMLYRRGRDIHTQFPPKSLSVSINLMIVRENDNLLDQFHFDMKERRIASYPAGTICSRRASLVKFAEYIGDENTRDIVTYLSRNHECRRTRIACFDALRAMGGDHAADLVSDAFRDRDPVVRRHAQAMYAELAA